MNLKDYTQSAKSDEPHILEVYNELVYCLNEEEGRLKDVLSMAVDKSTWLIKEKERNRIRINAKIESYNHAICVLERYLSSKLR